MLKKLATTLFATSASLFATQLTEDITYELPLIEVYTPDPSQNFTQTEDVAMYKNATWDNVVGISKGISLKEATQIADSNPEITFFFYTKGQQMVLENEDGTYRLFHKGDTVFFTGEPWWASAPNLADGYVKK